MKTKNIETKQEIQARFDKLRDRIFNSGPYFGEAFSDEIRSIL